MTDEHAPWWVDPDLTFAAQAAVITDEAAFIDWAALEEALLAEGGPGDFAAGYGNPAIETFTTADLPPGMVYQPIYVEDQITGQKMWLKPDNSGIPALIARAGYPGSVINPAWVGWKEGRAISKAVVNSVLIPPPDKITIFAGPGRGPTWEEVWQWTTAEQRSHMTFIYDGETITGAELNAVTDIVAASVIKAMGGMVNNGLAHMAAVSLAIARRVDSLQLTTYGAVANLNTDAQDALARVKFLTDYVIPNLQAQITQVRTSIPIQIEHAIQANNIRIRDIWITPLRNDVAAERQQRIAADQSILQRVPGIVRSMAPELLAGTVAALSSLGTRVRTLEDEATNCVKPLCKLLGPGTQLGKLLKGLKLAAELAALAAILNMTEAEFVALIEKLVGRLAAVVGDVEQFLGSGGETVAGLIADATKDLI